LGVAPLELVLDEVFWVLVFGERAGLLVFVLFMLLFALLILLPLAFVVVGFGLLDEGFILTPKLLVLIAELAAKDD
jgi:hypothetical protein